tara:strand:- start:1105 stop:1308 length:204 start_codon:yes stop_codon:yes gene_type:complete
MVYKRTNLGFNYFIRNKRFLKKFTPKIPYHKQYETRDFVMKNNIDLKNIKNYYETKAFKNYKPNLKR